MRMRPRNRSAVDFVILRAMKTAAGPPSRARSHFAMFFYPVFEKVQLLVNARVYHTEPYLVLGGCAAGGK